MLFVPGTRFPAVGPVSVGTSIVVGSAAETSLNLARGRAPGHRVVGHRDLGSHALLLALLDPEVLSGFREQVLGPVERWDLDHGTEWSCSLAATTEIPAIPPHACVAHIL